MLHQNVLGTVGNTPIVRLNRVTRAVPANFFAKLEFLNPGGSIKDRIGFYMIEDAERRGLIKPGATIVEGTSGNTGVALAIAAAIKGYKCVFVLPDKMSSEKVQNLRAFGAKVVVTPTAVAPDDPRSYYSVSRRLAQETPNAFYINQYDNLSNRQAHFEMTAPEILRQMPEIDVFVAGIGTGGTICGVGQYFRQHKPDVQVVAVDPAGSIVYEYYKTGKIASRPKTYKIEGIGEDFIPGNYDLGVIDDMVQVEDKESFVMTRELLTREGLYCGVSSGSAVVGAVKWAGANLDRARGKNVLVILPDSGNRYLSKVFNDDWMREAGFLEEPSLGRVADLLRVLDIAPGRIRMAAQTDKLVSVIDLMREHGISQVPVRDEMGYIKGIVSESSLLSALYQGRAKPTDSIELLVDPSVEFVTPDMSIDKVSRLVTAGKTPLVIDSTHDGHPVALIAKIDLLTYFEKRT